MEETLEMITWSQLGIHKKPVLVASPSILSKNTFFKTDFFPFQMKMQVGLLNVEGYYNSLLNLFDNGVKEGFIKPSARDIVLSAPTAKELLEKMEV